MNTFLTREQITNYDDLETEEVEVWGGKVLVRALTALERETLRMEVDIEKEGESQLLLVKLASLCIIDENGKRLFTEKDIPLLCKKSAQSLDKIFFVAQRLSGLGKEGLEEIKAK